jgi:glycosyltransferase involved in cell wall biosynthesis
VPQTSLLTDDLLRHLIAVGQVDIVVGVPTLNNAETIGGTLKAIDEGLAAYFPRDRTVVIAADGGSRDGTPDIIAERSDGGGKRAAFGALRTRHQISGYYGSVPGKAGALRLIFAAADLLQARAVAVLDPEVTSAVPAWIGALVGPVLKDSFDLVAPRYGRHPLEGLMLTQLVRPLLRATYGRRMDEPLLGEFGCSGRITSRRRPTLSKATSRRSPGRSNSPNHT